MWVCFGLKVLECRNVVENLALGAAWAEDWVASVGSVRPKSNIATHVKLYAVSGDKLSITAFFRWQFNYKTYYRKKIFRLKGSLKVIISILYRQWINCHPSFCSEAGKIRSPPPGEIETEYSRAPSIGFQWTLRDDDRTLSNQRSAPAGA